MATWPASIAKVVKTQIDAFGTAVTVRYVTNGAYSTATQTASESTTDATGNAIFEKRSKRDREGSQTKRFDRLWVAAEKFTTLPQTKDRIVIDSKEREIVFVDTIFAQNTKVLLEIHAAR